MPYQSFYILKAKNENVNESVYAAAVPFSTIAPTFNSTVGGSRYSTHCVGPAALWQQQQQVD